MFKVIFFLKFVTDLREETEDFGTSTFAPGLSGTSCNEAIIPALSISSSRTSASDCPAESVITQADLVSTQGW